MTGIEKFAVSALLIILLLGTGGGLAALLIKTAPEIPSSHVEPPPQLVETLALTPGDRVEWIVGYGSARADQVATLAAEVKSTVRERVGNLKAGVPVRKDQLLIRLDDREYQEQLRRARQLAAVDQAEIDQLQVERQNLEKLVAIAREKVKITASEEQRVRALFLEENAAESEYNVVKLAHQNSLQSLQDLENQIALIDPRKIRLEASRDARLGDAAVAELDVDRCRIVAPFDGQVEEVMVEVGDAVQPGTPILRVITTDRIEIPIELPVSVRSRVGLGAECMLTADSMPDVHWKGSISRIAPSADEQSRTFAAYVEVDNVRQDGALMPGYFLRAEVRGPTLENVLVIPRNVIVEGHVFVVDEDRARLREVTVSRTLRDEAVIAEGLRAGQQVIVTNLDVLYDGAPIRTKSTSESPAE